MEVVLFAIIAAVFAWGVTYRYMSGRLEVASKLPRLHVQLKQGRAGKWGWQAMEGNAVSFLTAIQDRFDTAAMAGIDCKAALKGAFDLTFETVPHTNGEGEKR